MVQCALPAKKKKDKVSLQVSVQCCLKKAARLSSASFRHCSPETPWYVLSMERDTSSPTTQALAAVFVYVCALTSASSWQTTPVMLSTSWCMPPMTLVWLERGTVSPGVSGTETTSRSAPTSASATGADLGEAGEAGGGSVGDLGEWRRESS